MRFLYILTIIAEVIIADEYLKCVNTKLAELESKRQKEVLLSEIQDSHKQPKHIERILETKDSISTTEIDRNVEKSKDSTGFVHSYTFKIKQVDVIAFIQRNEKLTEIDSFWFHNICKPGLMRLSYISETVATYFCSKICNESVLGQLIHYKFDRYVDLIKTIGEAFKEFKQLFSSKQYFTLELSFKSKNKELENENKELIKGKLDSVVEIVDGDLKKAFPVFKDKLVNLLKKNIYDFERPFSFTVGSNRIDDKSKSIISHFLGIVFNGYQQFKPGEWYSSINDEDVKHIAEDDIVIYQNYINYMVRKSGLANDPIYLRNIRDSLTISCFRTLARISDVEITRSSNVIAKCEATIKTLFERIQTTIKELSLLESNEKLIDRIRYKLNARLYELFGGESVECRYSELGIPEFVDLVLRNFVTDFAPLINDFTSNLTILDEYIKHSNISKDIYPLIINWYYYFCDRNANQKYFIERITDTLKAQGSSVASVDSYIKFKNTVNSFIPSNFSCSDAHSKNKPNEIFRDTLRNNLLERYPKRIELVNILVNKVQTIDDQVVETSEDFVKLVVHRLAAKMDHINLEATAPDILEENLTQTLEKEIRKINKDVGKLIVKYKENQGLSEAQLEKTKRRITKTLANQIKQNNPTDIQDSNISENDKICSFNFKATFGDEPTYCEILHDAEELDLIDGAENQRIQEYRPDSFNTLDLIQKLETTKIDRTLPSAIKSDIKFLLRHYSDLPDEVKNVLEACHKQNPLRDSVIKACVNYYENPNACVTVAPGLLSGSCDGYYNNRTGVCSPRCPMGYNYTGNGYCHKPKAYQLNNLETTCDNGFRRFEHWCMPVCPLGWTDFGSTCKIPKGNTIKNFYVTNLQD